MHHRIGRRRLLLALVAAVTVLAWLVGGAAGASAAANCSAGSTMTVVAHEDDAILFLNPDLLHDIQSGRCIQSLVVTAGDDGRASSYWQSREQGVEAAYAAMAGVSNSWTQSDAGISGHPMSLMTLVGNPKISLVFMQLPDGNDNGSGFPSHQNQSLQKLYTGQISQIGTVDGSSSYTKSQIVSTLTQLMTAFKPDKILTQDFVGTYGDGDHSDHHTVAYLTQQASRSYTGQTHTLTGYLDYGDSSKPSNVTGPDFAAKSLAWFTYTPFDNQVCQTPSACQQEGTTWLWLQAQYTVGSETDGPGHPYPPTADAGPAQTVNQSLTVTLDGSQSFDPGGNPTYQWTQTGGPAVTLSSSSAVKPTFTSPSGATTLTFQLVVSDGGQTSQPDSVTISVTTPNIAPAATVTASSDNPSTGQTAAKAVDGVIDGYPGDYTKEWATVGGGVGSWLKLTWTGAYTINKVVLYDRPNLGDQITGATLTFSDGSTVPVPALNNDGSATVVTFPAKTTTSLLMTVTAVSSSTQSVGLSEVQVFTTGTSNQAPTANAGPNQSVSTNSKVTLDGSASFDPNGNPIYTWTQTGGPAVTLSSSTAVQPTFTAPGSSATLTFQLVVSDGSLSSTPSTVTITDTSPPTDLALTATATASSQNSSTSQLASSAIDGVLDGYPGDYTKEWATVGGGVGSWLKLTWSNAQTIHKVVLYDRPNLSDQITGGTLTFSDGTTVNVPSLNNDGTATTITLPNAVTTTSLLLTVTSVSSTTQNVGLSEIQAF